MKNSFTVNDAETQATIATFLELGHVDNIIAMFSEDPSLYAWTGTLLNDERFMVRMGMVVLFETLAEIRPNDIPLALDSLLPLLNEKTAPYVRGEAATIIGLMNNKEAHQALEPLKNDPDPQVREIVIDIYNTAII